MFLVKSQARVEVRRSFRKDKKSKIVVLVSQRAQGGVCLWSFPDCLVD